MTLITPTKNPTNPSAKRWYKQRWFIILAVIVLLFVIISVIATSILYREATAGKDAFLEAQDELSNQEFIAAGESLGEASKHFTRARNASRFLAPVKWVPWVSTQFKAVDNLLSGAVHVASGVQHITGVADSIFSGIQSDSVTIANLSGKERKALLQAISDSPEQLAGAQTELALAVEYLEAIPKQGVVRPLAEAIAPVQDQLPVIDQVVNKALPFLEVAPTVLGYPEQQNYLFLLQNNTELRPTGGFIGTYGILQMKDADIKDFKTDNIYNLDFPVKETLFIDPPAPLAKYLVITQWFMRDSNWHPDFGISARKAEEFYHLENGPVKKIDGVIAITPDVIKDLLEVTGPITVEGQEFTSENFIEKLQYEVEIGFKQDGILESARKDIIGKMAGQLMDRIQNLQKSDWPHFIEVLLDGLETKHLLVYSKNNEAQALIHKLDWGGTIQQPEGDFVMVVDANLAAKKTDRVMTKNIDYALRKEGDKYLVDLTLRYYNDGQFDFFTTRYRTYTRIYVPQGSTLVAANGFLTTDRNEGGVPVNPVVTVDEDVNKTVFEGFISAEPKTEEVVTLTYELPQRIAQQIDSGEYQLFIQKQPGSDNVTFNAQLQFDNSIKRAVGVDNMENPKNNEVHFSVPLLKDNSILVNL